MTHLRQIMLEELERRNYAPGTIRSYIRQMNTADTEAVSANIRLRWNYRPDSDFYVIYTAGPSFASLAASNPPQFYENKLTIKVTYSWRP